MRVVESIKGDSELLQGREPEDECFFEEIDSVRLGHPVEATDVHWILFRTEENKIIIKLHIIFVRIHIKKNRKIFSMLDIDTSTCMAWWSMADGRQMA